jgi:hypothetical protein
VIRRRGQHLLRAASSLPQEDATTSRAWQGRRAETRRRCRVIAAACAAACGTHVEEDEGCRQQDSSGVRPGQVCAFIAWTTMEACVYYLQIPCWQRIGLLITLGNPPSGRIFLKLQWFERLDFGGQHIANHCSFMCFPKSPKHTGNTLPPEAMGRPARPAPGLGEQRT